MAGVVLHSGYTVLRCAEDGSIDKRPDGLYDFDTRVLSRWRLTVDGKSVEVVTAQVEESDTWQAVLRVAQKGGKAAGPRLPQDALEIVVRRVVGPSMQETISLRNWTGALFSGRLGIALDADFADIAPDDPNSWRSTATFERRWLARRRELRFDCRAEREARQFERGLSIIVGRGVRPLATDDGLAFELELVSQDEATIELEYVSHVDGQERRTNDGHRRRVGQRVAWRARRPRVEGPPMIVDVLERAADDLFELRNWELEEECVGRRRGGEWVLNAGVPTFTGFFGRDALTAGWQASMLGPRATLGALAVVAATQSAADDPWRDAEPGKMIHEMRRGPLAMLGLSPRDRYYGTQTTPHMFVLALSELWHWTADIDLLRRYRDAALRGLEWAERYGDLDGDGLLEYQRRSPKGLRNQGWKDSDEAIRHADGALAEGPIATVEEQAFYFLAMQRMAEILLELDEAEQADDFLRRADELRRRWHDAFWMADERFYALALDGDKRQVRSITSNPGHALGCGIVPVEHAAAVADRLMSDDLFSGWGIRTLSDRHPSYNPFAYHLGSVWPVEQATFALGFKRYGLDEHTLRLASAMLEAAAAMPDHRLPEAISGHARQQLGRPIPYPQANSPQAWSASAVVQLIQIMLGLYPFAALNVLALVRPRLPGWVPELTLQRLRVGKATVDLRFTLRPDGTADAHVVRRRGPLLVVPAGPPVSAEPRPLAESIKAAALAAMPTERARAVRIALGVEQA